MSSESFGRVNMKFKRVNLKIELLILEGNIRNFKISKDIYEISLINKKLRIEQKETYFSSFA